VCRYAEIARARDCIGQCRGLDNLVEALDRKFEPHRALLIARMIAFADGAAAIA